MKKIINKNDKNEIVTDDIFRLADLYFNKKNYIFRHLYDSYNKFIEEDVKNFLEYGEHIFTEIITTNTYYKYRFKFENVRIEEPTIGNGIESMFPADARHSRMTYSIKLIANVTQYQDIIDIASDHKVIKTIGHNIPDCHVGTIPLMVRSKWCSLITNKGIDKNECDYDPGGYFIVNGNEKVIISQDRMVENKPLVFVKKDSGSMTYTVQVNSKSYKPHGMIQVMTVKLRKDGILMIRVPILNEVNVCAVFRALGMESDKDIIDYITYDDNDTDMIALIRISLDACKNEKGYKVSTQEEAIDYLIPKLRVLRRYNETDKETKLNQKKLHLKNLLNNNFLPHVEGNMMNKAHYLGYMINRLLKIYLGRQKLDDRDSYINKRIDLPGDLMFDLFRQQYKKMLSECKKFFDNRNKSNDNPINVISNIKPNIIEQGFKASLSTGHWIRRQGVAQMLQRLNYLQIISFLRRIDAPGGDSSSMKLTSPRFLHPSSVGMLCPVETPEHAKVGLTKHLSMIGSITIMSRDQYSMLKEYLLKKVTNLIDVSHYKLKDHNIYKVFLNGDWLGIVEKYLELENEMSEMKLKGDFDQKNVSIITDHEEGEIHVYCDSGRLYRPVFRIVDNQLLLTKEHINSISLNKADKLKKITDLDEFLIKYPGIIEYIDMEMQPYIMIADKMKKVKLMREKMINSLELEKNVITRHIDNRYDDMFYLKYTHCEIHPSLLIGAIMTNIPFCDNNQAPRNIFNYSQSRQSMGIYATNYRDRLDISFILYHPQKPLVTTRTSRYTNFEILPTGENTIVAIACYTGYNQEDSLIVNKSSIERGKFRGMCLKKYSISVQKNQSTSQDDIFMKPDPTKVTNMKHGSYDKLNDKGYAPEETKLENGDAIFGKVTPVSDTSGIGKPYRDSSEIFKMHASGVVDRVYIDIQNQDGYSTREALIRSERIPKIGDKYCFPESANIEVLTNNGWINIKDVNKEHKVATLVDNKYISYQNPTEIYKFDYNGDIYKLRTNAVDIDCTMNHKLYAKLENQLEYELIEASQLIGKQFTLKKNCENNNTDNDTFNISYDKYININNNIKKLYDWIWTLSQNQSRILLEYMILDNNNNNDIVYYTSSIDLANDMMRLAIHCGWSGTMILEKYNNYCIQINKTNTINEPQINYEIQNDSIYHYNGNVYCLEVSSHIMMIRQNGKHVWISNSSRHGQKGTIGILLDAVDMPFTKNGIVPDIILNPNAIPSRMTIGQLVECLVGKTAILQGMDADGTAFDDHDIESAKNKLEELGYERNGYEYLYNGMTGEKMKVQIFIGPTFYQRLKHLVEDKIHCLTINHDVLTKNGWKQINNINITDEIATLSNNNNIEYQCPTNVYHYNNYEGKLYNLVSNKIDITVTANHRMYVSNNGTTFDFEYAENILGKSLYHKNMNGSFFVDVTQNDTIEKLYNVYKNDNISVYCISVPNEIFFIRCNGKSVWTGNSRSRGPKTSLTRQAPEGRSRDGGLRLGEMERDALLAHGLAKFIKEKLLDNSDAYTTYICDKCGLFAQRFDKKENKSYASDNDIYYCPACKNHNDISKIKIPYAFKLFLHELMAMCIAPRIRCVKTIYNS